MSARLEPGDCREVLAALAALDEEFDACITDPPYDLVSVVKRFGKAGSAPAKHGTDGLYARQSRGFMGKEWDGTGVAFDPETWRAVWEVLKPGAHLLAFGGTRTFHRMAVAIEDAGFEIRDCMMWLYGTGFPKSHDVSKGIDREAGAVREVVGVAGKSGRSVVGAEGHVGGEYFTTAPATPEAAAWSGWGTALKPAWEPIIVARKPVVGTVAANVLQFGTGALNIDGCRVGLPEGDPLHDGVQHSGAKLDTRDGQAWGFKAVDREPGLGRWPANVLHDGSDEVEGAFAAFGESKSPGVSRQRGGREDGRGRGMQGAGLMPAHGDSGTASRFFYSAKASAKDRAGSKHPTVKPLALMRYLCRLVTPPGGTVLDLFAGSGTTLQAAAEEGFSAVGIERDPEYQADIRRRLANMADPDAATLAELCA